MHQSCLKNHMCVLGWISRSHARDGSEIQTSGRRGSAEKIGKLGFLLPVISKLAWKSWNLAWCHDMAPTCYRNFIGRIGTGFCVSFLQNLSFAQEDSWFREGTCHLCVRNDIRCLSPDFLYRGNIELYEGPVKFWNYFGFVWPFYTLIEFLDF